MQLLHITTEVVSRNPVHCVVYSVQHNVIKFVGDLQKVGGFIQVSSTNRTDRHDITEILLKVALNTITITLWWRGCNLYIGERIVVIIEDQSSKPLDYRVPQIKKTPHKKIIWTILIKFCKTLKYNIRSHALSVGQYPVTGFVHRTMLVKLSPLCLQSLMQLPCTLPLYFYSHVNQA